MIKIDDKRIKEFETDLKRFKRRAYPFATKATINNAAWEARGFAQENIRNGMTTRNRFTVNSVQVEQSRTLNVSRQAATVGSIADYMEDQEFGATIRSKGKHGVPIATAYSAGQGQNTQPRTRLPRKPNTMRAIQLRKLRKTGSRKQRNFVAVKMAASSGSKYVFLDLGRRKGIFRVLGGKRNPRIKMVWSMGHRSVVVPKNPWLGPAVRRTEQEMPRLYRDALRFQLRKHNLFRS